MRALIALSMAALSIGVQEPTNLRYALTPDSFARAIADTKGGVELQAALPYQRLNRREYRIFEAHTPGDPVPDPQVTINLLKNGPFEVYVLTPYARAAITAADARRRFAEPRIDPNALNDDGILVSIAPSTNFITSESIDAVVLSVGLGHRIVKPFRQELEQRTLSNAMGASKTVTIGAFHFRLTDFDEMPITIITVGAAQSRRWLVDDVDLAR